MLKERLKDCHVIVRLLCGINCNHSILGFHEDSFDSKDNTLVRFLCGINCKVATEFLANEVWISRLSITLSNWMPATGYEIHEVRTGKN